MDIRFSLDGIKLNTNKLTKFTKKKSTSFFFLLDNFTLNTEKCKAKVEYS